MKNQNLYKKVLVIAIPMMIQNGITNMVNLVDNLMVGSLGTENMTGVSIVGQLLFVYFLAIFGGLSGPGIYGAQYYGQGNRDGFQNIFRLKIWIATILTMIGIMAFIVGGQAMMGLYMHGTQDGIDPVQTVHAGISYLNIMLIGLVPMALTQVYAGSLREMGQSVKPMVAGIVSVVVDIICNYMLIFGKLGCPKLGVKGAAIATVIARFAELLVILVWTHSTLPEDSFLKHVYRTLRFPLGDMRIVIRKGMPILCNEFMWAGGIAALTQCYSIRGLQVVAALNISNILCNLINVVFVALGNAVGIIMGQYLGASRFQEAKEGSDHLMWFTAAVCVVLTVILIALSGIFPQAYQTTDEVRSMAGQLIIITAVFFPLQGALNVLYFTLRSGGKTLITFLFDSVYSWLVSVTVAFVLSRYTPLPILAVYAVVQSADVIKVTIGYILVKKGVWLTNLVETV